MKIQEYSLSENAQKKWNDFVENSNEGTIFHRLDFLQYHGDKYRQNEKHLVFLKGSTLWGVLSIGIFEQENGERIARSPYGASYGGPVFMQPLEYEESQQIVAALLEYLTENHIATCTLTLPITCCYRKYSETFRLALMELGFQCTNRDISSVVPLNTGRPVDEEMTKRARNMSRKAINAGVVRTHQGSVDDFWKVLEKTYEKHGTNSTHSQREFKWLVERIPGRVYADVAYLEGEPIAGIGFFVINQRVNSSFYLCQDPEYQSTQSLSWLISAALMDCEQSGYQWFDFGTSSVNMQGRANIFRFKESFGAIGWFRDTYTWKER